MTDDKHEMTAGTHTDRIMFRAIDRARKAIDAALATPADELGRMFTTFNAARIAKEAEVVDGDSNRRDGALAGLTISIKDLFDESGIVTTAGSRALASETPAKADATAIARLKVAGAVPCGRTSMSEFAFSGVGLNPHFGNPTNVFDRRLISGGSTSGGALTVAKGICDAALGTDTGGSVRIPAALNGLAGFKPTQASVPLSGAFPLSQTYDSIGPIARSVRTCAAIHAVLSAKGPDSTAPRRPRLGVARGSLLEGLDAAVAADFDAALALLSRVGFELIDTDQPQLGDFGRANRIIVASEAYAVHEQRLSTLETLGDPRVLKRIRAAETFSSKEVDDARAMRRAGISAFVAGAAEFDAFLAPTVPVVAPAIAEVEADFDRLNALMLRNPSAVNFLDGCAATIPMQGGAQRGTGLMIFAPGGRDWPVLDIASRAEAALL